MFRRELVSYAVHLILTSDVLEDCSEQCVALAVGHVGSDADRAVSDHHGHICWAIKLGVNGFRTEHVSILLKS